MKQEQFKSNKWRTIGIHISICIDKILTAGHKISIKYNPLGRQVGYNEPEEIQQDSDSDNDAAQAKNAGIPQAGIVAHDPR